MSTLILKISREDNLVFTNWLNESNYHAEWNVREGQFEFECDDEVDADVLEEFLRMDLEELNLLYYRFEIIEN